MKTKLTLVFCVTAGICLPGGSLRGQSTLLDTSFNPGSGAADGLVETVVPQPDGKVLICGDFGSINGAPQAFVARLDRQGNVDGGFQARVSVLTVIGREYFLQHRQPGSTHWLSEPPIGGDGTMRELTDPEASSSNSRLYRVLVN